MSLEKLLGIAIGAGTIGSACGWVFFGSWIQVVVWFLAAACLPMGYVYLRRNQRTKRLCEQLPEALEVMSRAVRAGQTLPAAIQIIANDFEAPISAEFARCYEQQNLGMAPDASLRDLARRTQIMELRIFAVALLVQSRAGGNLVELLDNLSGTVRKRLQLQGKIRAVTGEGRMQAAVLMVLPAAALLGLLILSPDYVAVLLQRPWLLGGTVGAQVAGAVWIRRIVHFEF